MLVKQVRMEISRCRQLDYHISSGRWKSGKSAGQIRENSGRASQEGRKKGRVMAPGTSYQRDGRPGVLWKFQFRNDLVVV